MKLLKSALFITLIIFSALPALASEKLTGEEGLTTLLAQHKGDVIYLDFWASWCGPCRKSFPWLDEMQTRFNDKGFTVVSVNLDANYALAQEFLTQHPISFSVVFDPKGKTAKKYQVKGMPTSYLIDRSGVIIKGHTGFFADKIPVYEAEIKQLLNQGVLPDNS